MTRRYPDHGMRDWAAAGFASKILKRDVPMATIRRWRHNKWIKGGPGWVDRESFADFLDRWKARPPDA